MRYLIILLILLSACNQQEFDWKSETYKDINTNEKFTINDYTGKTLLIEFFAVWCPTCTRQQQEIKKLHLENPDVISISFDVDPNENEKLVLEHAQRNGFDWIYSIMPASSTKQLISEYGPVIVHAPSVPMLIICPDGTEKLLGKGLKLKKDLQDEILKCQ